MFRKQITPYLAIVLFAMIALSCNPGPSEGSWQVAFKHDENGKPLSGSKEQLFAAIRAGKDLKIGWGWNSEERGLSIEHLADPIWLAILDQKEVIAHLEPQVLSGIDWNSGTASYADSALLSQEWRVVINTDGTFDAVWYDRKENKLLRHVPQRHIITWFVSDLAHPKTQPLFSRSPQD